MSEERDIVERLVDGVVWSDRGRNMGPDEIDEAATDAIMNDAASEITCLRGEVERLEQEAKKLRSAVVYLQGE